jgi:hypothetical protein
MFRQFAPFYAQANAFVTECPDAQRNAPTTVTAIPLFRSRLSSKAGALQSAHSVANRAGGLTYDANPS